MHASCPGEEGIPSSTLREIFGLVRCSDLPEVITIRSWFHQGGYSSEGSICVVMERLKLSLVQFIHSWEYKGQGSEEQYRLPVQLIQGVADMASRGVVHRDLKPSNIMLDKDHNIKIIDLGMCKLSSGPGGNTNFKTYFQACTLWYRAPELMLRCHSYQDKVDAWSLGCILIEFFTRMPVFRGTDNAEILQLFEIFKKMGTPTQEEALEMGGIWDPEWPKWKYAGFIEQTVHCADMRHVIKNLLQINPARRWSVATARGYLCSSEKYKNYIRQQ